MSPSSLKELGITAELIAKADKITDCVQDEGFWKALQGIAELWEPVAEVGLTVAVLLFAFQTVAIQCTTACTVYAKVGV